MLKFGIVGLRWFTGFLSAGFGTMMLVAPDQFSSFAYAAMQPRLAWWGVAFLMVAVVLVSAGTLWPRTRIRFTTNLLAGMVWLAFSYGSFASGDWMAGALLGAVGVAVTLLPWIEDLLTGTDADSLEAQLSLALEKLKAANAHLTEANKETRRMIAELDATISAVADAVLIYNPTGELVRLNPSAQRLLDIEESRSTVAPVDRLASLRLLTPAGEPFPTGRLPVERALAGETVEAALVTAILPSEKRLRFSASAAPILDADGNLAGAVVTLTDVSALHRMQEHQRDMMRAVSHDLRTPLTSILGNAQLLHRTLASSEVGPRVVPSAEVIVSAARRMDVMIKDMVESARLETMNMRVEKQLVELGALVREVIDRHSETVKGGRIKTDFPNQVVPVEVDPNAFERILTNLITNALKYSPEDTEVLVRIRAEADSATVSVVDHGRGIPADELHHVFDRYYRARNGLTTDGLGLGLYITRLLVEAHGGTVKAESVVGVGSTFGFALPKAQGAEL